MSNPGVIYLTKFQKESFYFAIEDNIGEAIHIHYADDVINIRVDLTIKEFINLANDMELVLDILLEGKAKCADFDSIFFADLGYDFLINLERITTDSIMLEDILVQEYQSDGKIITRPIMEARLGKAFKGDHSENDKYKQINYLSPTGRTLTNKERIDKNFQRIKENGGFSESDYIWLNGETNIIRDGQHRAMCLYALKGNCPVPVRRIWFRHDNIPANNQSSLDEKHEQLAEKVDLLDAKIDNLHKEIVEKTSLKYFAKKLLFFLNKRILKL